MNPTVEEFLGFVYDGSSVVFEVEMGPASSAAGKIVRRAPLLACPAVLFRVTLAACPLRMNLRGRGQSCSARDLRVDDGAI